MSAGYDRPLPAHLPPIEELVVKHGELVKRIALVTVTRIVVVLRKELAA